jgi:1,4-dihydroxy-2-naphthoyl-CoA synthase
VPPPGAVQERFQKRKPTLQENSLSTAIPELTTMAIELNEGLAEITLNRPERSNAINQAMWQELRMAFCLGRRER